jgi:hypothetical protein
VKGLLIVNPRSGRGGPDLDELVAESRRLGIETHVLQPGDAAAEIARGSEAERYAYWYPTAADNTAG